MNFIKTNIKLFIELVAVVGLVLLFFGLFVSMLNFVFPSGANLGDMMGKGWISATMRPGGASEAEDEPIVLSRIEKTVKNKRADDIVWTPAQAGSNLYNRDAVQTFTAAAAQLTIGKGNNYLELGENSLVIIGRSERDGEKQEKRSLLVMMSGELRGKISQTGKERLKLEVSTPNSIVRIDPEQHGKSAMEFKVSVNPDKSSTITVLKGSAEVISQGGQAVQVEENQSTTVVSNGPPAVPKAPLPEVTLIEPADEQIIYYREIPPRVNFAWLAVTDEKEYRFILARDKDFRELVVNEWVNTDSYFHGNLKEGNYFWKVELRQESVCETRRVRIERITKPPDMQLQPVPKIVYSDHYTIKGTAAPDNRIIAEGRDVAINGKGVFEYDVKLQHGINIVVIEAVDKAGNISYHPVKIYAKTR